MSITFKVVDQFFDRPAVSRAVDKARRRNLSKAGSYVRRTARSSIRSPGRRRMKRKRERKFRSGHDPTISRPGQPPRRHVGGKRNLRMILFAWDAPTESVVVGPVVFGNSVGVKDVPGILEHGGKSKTRKKGKSKKTKTIRVRPRPFMGPALEKEAPKFPDIWRNSIRR